MNKQLIYLCSGLLFCKLSSALNVEDGVYVGLLLGGSWAPAINVNPSSSIQVTYQGTPTTIPITSSLQLNYEVLGQVAGQVGYRFENFRTELEFFYNSNTYSNVVLNGTTFSANNSTENFYTGQTNSMFGMFNIYYDLLPPADSDGYFGPFVGIGAGYGNIQNTLAITYNSEQITPGDLARSHKNYGGQVIGGFFAFLDGFSYFLLDFRYFVTPNYTQNVTFKNQTATINNQTITVTETIQPITYKNQILSVNLTFNGALDLG